MKIKLFLLLAIFVSFGANAAIKVSQPQAKAGENIGGYEWQKDESYQEMQEIATLENDIRILDEEIAKCKKKKKGWTAATIVGGAGVIATGIGAIVQNNKLKEKKETYNEKREEYNNIKKQVKETENQ